MKAKQADWYISIKQVVKRLVIFFFGSKKYLKLVVIGRQRTGSSLLITLLRSHPQIEILGEIFRIIGSSSCREIWSNNFTRKLPWLKYAGFKLFYYHPEDSDDRDVWKLIDEDKSIRIIHMKRENILRTHISKLIANKTGAWNSRQKKKGATLQDKRIHVDVEECLNEMRKIKQWEEDFGIKRFSDHPYMEMTYEALTDDIHAQMEKVCDFLEIKNAKVESDLRRQNPERLEDLIINYDELEKKLTTSEFAYLLS